MPLPSYFFLIYLVSLSLALSSHSPPDLLAYPKFSLTLADWNNAISNATASHLLSNFKNFSTSSHDDDQLSHSNSQPSETLGLSLINLKNDDQISQDQPNLRHTLMRTSSGQAFLCTLPPLPSPPPKPSSSFSSADSSITNSTNNNNNQQEPNQQERKLERERIEKEGLQNGLKLISALKDRCIYTRLGWFTYSFCYGKGEIRQFHALMIPGHSHPHEDPNQDVYVLGFHLDHPQNPHHQARLDGTLPGATATAGEGALTTLGRSRFSAGAGPTMGISDVLREEVRETAVEEEEFGQKRYLVQRWDGGTICDMTGRPRAVEVQFHCSTVGSDHIALLRETAICEYLLVIHTPRLCSEPLFLDGGSSRKGIGAGDSVGEIACRPVLSDEEMDMWNASEEAKKRKKAEQEARQQKAIEDEQAAAAAKAAAVSEEKEGLMAIQPSSEDGVAGHADPTPADATQAEPAASSAPAEPVAGAEPAATDSARAEDTAEGAQETKPAKGKPASAGQAIDVDPITVYFDTDTGQIYMDEADRKAPSGAETADGAGARGQTEGGGRGRQEEDGYEQLEHITKALKESLGALLRDLRGTEEGERGARVNGARVERPGTLAELVASLKESGGGAWKGKSNKAGAGKPAGTPSGGVVKAKVSEEHEQLMKMYGQKFEVGGDNDEVGEEGKEEGKK